MSTSQLCDCSNLTGFLPQGTISSDLTPCPIAPIVMAIYQKDISSNYFITVSNPIDTDASWAGLNVAADITAITPIKRFLPIAFGDETKISNSQNGGGGDITHAIGPATVNLEFENPTSTQTTILCNLNCLNPLMVFYVTEDCKIWAKETAPGSGTFKGFPVSFKTQAFMDQSRPDGALGQQFKSLGEYQHDYKWSKDASLITPLDFNPLDDAAEIWLNLT